MLKAPENKRLFGYKHNLFILTHNLSTIYSHIALLINHQKHIILLFLSLKNPIYWVFCIYDLQSI